MVNTNTYLERDWHTWKSRGHKQQWYQSEILGKTPRKMSETEFVQRQVKKEKENRIERCIRKITRECKNMLKKKIEEIEDYNSSITQEKHKQYNCFNCNQKGHVYKACPAKAKEVENQSQGHIIGFTKGSRAEKNIRRNKSLVMCFKCKNLGHFANKCPSKRKNLPTDESILDDVSEFTTKYLKENLKIINEVVSALVSHSLDIPLHWRVPRVEAKWFIHHYEKKSDRDLTLVELSMLDFDMLQAVYLEDLKHTSRWWKNIRWSEKLSFTRDRLQGSTVCLLHLMMFMICMVHWMKLNDLLTPLKGGTSTRSMTFQTMKICFLGYHNTINEITYNILTESRFFVLPCLKNRGRFIQDIPIRSNLASVSICGWVILLHVRCLTSFSSIEEVLQCMERSKNLIRYSSDIFRLADEWEEMAQGDISKSIRCYMHESGATEEEAKMHIKCLIMETWKKLNKELACMDSHIPREFIDCVTNIPRMAPFMYNKGDGHGHPAITKSHWIYFVLEKEDGNGGGKVKKREEEDEDGRGGKLTIINAT
uniref:R-linalool synthase QH1, chloroplastic-like n=1 Tax=Tanacetum cinerariifolium TaxID=118510 RepID=A0A6L2LYH3_TANCI|nr:R-linalool synthase QH1, chloroplastic-like [Tanacetum cinerariifolium]